MLLALLNLCTLNTELEAASKGEYFTILCFLVITLVFDLSVEGLLGLICVSRTITTLDWCSSFVVGHLSVSFHGRNVGLLVFIRYGAVSVSLRNETPRFMRQTCSIRAAACKLVPQSALTNGLEVLDMSGCSKHSYTS